MFYLLPCMTLEVEFQVDTCLPVVSNNLIKLLCSWYVFWKCQFFLELFVVFMLQYNHPPYLHYYLDPIIVAHYQGHKPIHWKTRRAGNDNVYTGLTQYTVNVIQNQREVRYVHQILFPIRYFWHPIPPFKTHTQFKDSPPCCSPLCNTTKTNMAPI